MLAQRHRLKRTQDFQTVRKRGRHLRGRLLSLNVMPNNLPYNRFGFVVSRRVGKAVTRNRLKRRLRAAIYQWLPSLSTGYDIVVVAHPEASTAAYQDLKAKLEELLRSARLLVVSEL